MSEQKYKVAKQGPVARLVLTNAEKHNAFDDDLIEGLIGGFLLLGAAKDVQVVVLEAEGRSFSAGADLNWMKRMASYGPDENLSDARMLGRLMQTINFLPKPVVAKVQGAAFGGGVGLAACCDIAIGSERASFCLSETKLGLIPGVISPYVVSAIGARAARRYFMTAERFDAQEALRLGLLHQVVPEDRLDAAVDQMVETLLQVGPRAAGAAKDLVFTVDRPIDEDVIEETARRIAEIRGTDEAQEGMNAFLEKREPAWRTKTTK